MSFGKFFFSLNKIININTITSFEFGAAELLSLSSTNLAHFPFLFDIVTMQCMELDDLTGLNVKILCIYSYYENTKTPQKLKTILDSNGPGGKKN